MRIFRQLIAHTAHTVAYYQARRNEKNSGGGGGGGGGWEFIKKCWPTWLADQEDRRDLLSIYAESVLKVSKHFKSPLFWSLSAGLWCFNIS